jgi:RNA polymerase sigma-70 factor, ECF subfamily
MPERLEAAYTDHRDLVVAAAHAVLRDRGLAEDVAQDVFERLWRHGGWDPARGPLVPYLRLVARSRALDVLRSRAAADRTRERCVAADRPAAAHEPADEGAARRLDERRVRAAVRALPHAQREAVALTYWGGLSTAEVADATAAPHGTAKSRVRLGVQRLRDELPAA